MPPLIVNFSLKVLTEVLGAHGCHVLEADADGTVVWGDEPLGAGPYTGKFTTIAPYIWGRYDIFSIRGLLSRLGKADEIPAVEEKLYPRGTEDMDDEGR